MYLQQLKLSNFKNYESANLALAEGINVFTGLNGSGKTNLLDAIYFLSISKSAFTSNDAANIRKGGDYFRIEGYFNKKGKEYLVETAFGNTTKKFIKINKALCEKVREHIGQFPVILITPYDTDVIREGSDERRKFFDSVFSQLDPVYLSELMRYNNVLKQRNSLLKQFFENNVTDEVLISAYDNQLLDAGKKIYELREKFTKILLPIFHTHYENLTGKKELIQLEYESQLSSPDFENEFKAGLRQEIFAQRTLRGIHKDDFIFQINDFPLKSYGSQGQQKSYVIALKLAQYDLIKTQNEVKPILLLDDIFDKLDDERIAKLIEIITQQAFGQIFITDARVERTVEFFGGMNSKMSIFKIENGGIKDQII